MLCGVCMFLASRDKCACSILYDLHSFLSWVLIFLRFGVSVFFFFFSSRRRHTRSLHDWSSDVCSSDLATDGWTRNAVFNQNTVEVERSDFEVQDRVQMTLSAEYELWKGWKTLGSLYYEGRTGRSEERRVGKECRSRWSPYQ